MIIGGFGVKFSIKVATLLLAQQFIDVFDVVERVVDVEREFGRAPQLVAQALRQVVADGRCVGVDVGQQLGGLSTGEDAQVHARHAQVGRHTHMAHADEHTRGLGRLEAENLAQLFLNQTINLFLSCSLQFSLIKKIVQS